MNTADRAGTTTALNPKGVHTAPILRIGQLTSVVKRSLPPPPAQEQAIRILTYWG